MIPVRYSSVPFHLLRNEMDRLFDDFLGAPAPFGSTIARRRRAAFPAFNVWENEEGYGVEAECPGLSIEDLELAVVGNQLTISGQRKEEYAKNASFHRQERGTGNFTRTISLPTDVEQDKVEASLNNGVLTVRLPKAQSAKPRKIEVRS